MNNPDDVQYQHKRKCHNDIHSIHLQTHIIFIFICLSKKGRRRRRRKKACWDQVNNHMSYWIKLSIDVDAFECRNIKIETLDSIAIRTIWNFVSDRMDQFEFIVESVMMIIMLPLTTTNILCEKRKIEPCDGWGKKGWHRKNKTWHFWWKNKN